VEQAVDALDETIKDIRAAIFKLQSRGETEPAPLRTRILAVIEEMTESLGFAPALRMAGQLDTHVPATIASQLLAALREGLANVAKHARASRVDVSVEAGPDLILTVRDNGAGLPETARRSGLGNLADRAGEFGGTFRAAPAEGGGTRLEWRVPLPSGSFPG
jgi:signal transduction histidine kinase